MLLTETIARGYSGEQGRDQVSLPPDTKEQIDQVDSFAEMAVGNSYRDTYQHIFDKYRLAIDVGWENKKINDLKTLKLCCN